MAQHTNPARNAQRQDMKALGRRQYLRAHKAGRALMTGRPYPERDLIA